VTLATWVLAGMSVLNFAAQLWHQRRDRARFSEHGQRIEHLENGKP